MYTKSDLKFFVKEYWKGIPPMYRSEMIHEDLFKVRLPFLEIYVNKKEDEQIYNILLNEQKIKQ